ncbi:Rbm39, partial [Symbiodinium sp. KB8]
GWEKEVEEDVEEECKKFGTVLHIHLDPNSTVSSNLVGRCCDLGLALMHPAFAFVATSQGDIYVMFQSLPSAETAARALNGRFYAGRTIRAEYLPRSEYFQRFPNADREE